MQISLFDNIGVMSGHVGGNPCQLPVFLSYCVSAFVVGNCHETTQAIYNFVCAVQSEKPDDTK